MIEKSLLTSINKPSEQLPEYLTKPNRLKNFFCIFFFFYLGFLLQTITNHRTVGEGGRHFFKSSLQLTPASQALTTLVRRLLQTAHLCT